MGIMGIIIYSLFVFIIDINSVLFNLINVSCKVKVKMNFVLFGLFLLIRYSLFDGIVDVILIANKNKTSYDALSISNIIRLLFYQ